LVNAKNNPSDFGGIYKEFAKWENVNLKNELI
jgi:hypothetical protein